VCLNDTRCIKIATKNDTLKRKEKVYRFVVMGMPQTEMAKKLRVSRSTIARDISELRHETGDWVREATEDEGHMLEYKLELDRLDDVIYDLRKLRNKVKKPSEIVMINREIANISKKRWDMYIKMPLAVSVSKFVKENIIQSKNLDVNCNGMKIIPEDVTEEDVRKNYEELRKRGAKPAWQLIQEQRELE